MASGPDSITYSKIADDLDPVVGQHHIRNGGMMTWWWQFVAFCLSLSAVLALLGLFGRWGHRMWVRSRSFNRFLDQLVGDENAHPPIRGLLAQFNDLRTELADTRSELVDTRSELAEHRRFDHWPTPPTSNHLDPTPPRHRRVL